MRGIFRYVIYTSFSNFLCQAILRIDKRSFQLSAGTDAGARPHILFILIDDLGFSDASFNREDPWIQNRGAGGITTPNMDKLAADGLILKRYYVHKMCSPTRSAIQTGRAPFQVNVNEGVYTWSNPQDEQGGFAGIPRNMTGIAHLLKRKGYKTHMVGKWDVGMATPEHTPAGRGYDSSLIYFSQESDYWSFDAQTDQCGMHKDLWEHGPAIPFPGKPAVRYLNNASCNAFNSDGCMFQDKLFEERVVSIIDQHNISFPLFLFWATHALHGPYDPPKSLEVSVRKDIRAIEDPVVRHHYQRMPKYYTLLRFVDKSVGNVVDRLKSRGMYKKTLIVLSSDNGGVPGSNQGPLRGVKFSNYEGGIRAAAFVSGGFLPLKVRGTSTEGLIAAWDWYATFAHLAGTRTFDRRAAYSKLPQPDSNNMWLLISGYSNKSSRQDITIGTNEGGYAADGRQSGEPKIGGIIKQEGNNLYKLILGEGEQSKTECGGRTYPGSPDTRKFKGYDSFCRRHTDRCGTTPEDGCLYELASDPGEENNLAQSHPEVLHRLLLMATRKQREVYSPDRGAPDYKACKLARDRGAVGPFAFMPSGNG